MRKVVDWDRHKLGVALGTLCALVVSLLCFWWQNISVLETIFRAGVAFLLAYVATFVLHTIILDVITSEWRAHQAKVRAERAKKLAEEAEAAESGDEAVGDSE